MTAATSRWLSAAIINFALITPALALDENFGNEPQSNATSNNQTSNNQISKTYVDGQTVSSTQTDTANSVNQDHVTTNNTDNASDQINVYDDPLTFNTLRRITLKQLRVDANASQPESVKDPLQPLNRKIFVFNNKLDQYLLLPVARRYKQYVPAPLKVGVSNFFSNLGEPWNAVNHLLQGHPKSSYRSLGRFTLNTFTSLGLADPAATSFGINREDQDFGLTLGKWGLKSGPFLMLPALGPSTLRDGTGRIADVYGRPQHYMDQNATYWIGNGLNVINTRAGFIGVENLVQGDQYALLRDLYLQRRQYLVTGDDPSNALDKSFGDDDVDFDDNSSTENESSNRFGDDSGDGFGNESDEPNNMTAPQQNAAPKASLNPDNRTAEPESDAAIEQDDVF